MGRVYVKNGTPLGTTSLCRSCSYGHSIEGYLESELIQVCNYGQTMTISFRVKTCSNHYDKGRPSWLEMQRLAIPLEPKKTLKPVGFLVKEVEEKSTDECDECND